MRIVSVCPSRATSLAWKVAFAGVCAVGCTSTQEGRVYSMADGKSAVIVAHDPPGNGGTLRASLPGGESCSGQFSDVGVQGASALGAFDVPLTNNSEASLAVLTCNRGSVLRCALAGRYDGGFSYGACKDARGQEYSVVF